MQMEKDELINKLQIDIPAGAIERAREYHRTIGDNFIGHACGCTPGGRWEHRKFLCGCEVGYIPNFEFGKGNYCAARCEPVDPCIDRTCPDAEVAAWNAEGEWLFKGDVIGYASPDEIAVLIGKVARGEPI